MIVDVVTRRRASRPRLPRQTPAVFSSFDTVVHKEKTRLKAPLFSSAARRRIAINGRGFVCDEAVEAANGRRSFCDVAVEAANGRHSVTGCRKRPEQPQAPNEAQASKPLQILLFAHIRQTADATCPFFCVWIHVPTCHADPHPTRGSEVGEMLTDGLMCRLGLSTTHRILFSSFESRSEDSNAARR